MSKPSPFCSWVGLISHKQRCVFNLDKVAFLALVAFQLCVFSHPGTACRHVYSSHHWPLRWPSTNNDRDGPLLSAWNSSFHTQTHGGFQSNGGTPNYPNHLAILVLKPMVTWDPAVLRNPHTHTYIYIYIYYKYIYIYIYLFKYSYTKYVSIQQSDEVWPLSFFWGNLSMGYWNSLQELHPGNASVTMKVVLVDLQIRRKMGIATFWSLTTRKNGDNVGIIGIVGIRNQQLSGDLTNKHVWYICQGDKLWIQWEWWEYIYGTGNLMRWIWYIYIYHPFN